MSREPVLLVADVVDAFLSILTWTEGVGPRQFVADAMLRAAVERSLTIAGEAAKNVPDAVKARGPDVDWRGLARLRDLLAHVYFHVDAEELWEITASRVPAALPALQLLLEQLKQERFGARDE